MGLDGGDLLDACLHGGDAGQAAIGYTSADWGRERRSRFPRGSRKRGITAVVIVVVVVVVDVYSRSPRFTAG